MIRLENLSKSFFVRGRKRTVAHRINAVFPTGVAVGLIGRNGAGKSTMLRMIAGTVEPTSGQVLTDGTVSWPVGFAGSFHPDLTGIQNLRFVARVYGVDTDELLDYVVKTSELGNSLQAPLRTYSSGMRSRLGFCVSMAIRFDTYLFDEVTAVGDAGFKLRSEEMLVERLRESSAVIASHSVGLLRRVCQAGAVLENGRLSYYEDVKEAIEHYTRRVAAAGSGSARRPEMSDA